MKPTVLIGLGGIGSQTVDTIYGMMNDEERKLTAAAVLDTDIGDLQKLANVKVKIQTSPDVKVGNYVYNHPEIMEWFPYEYAKINDMMLSDGAGQVRALSRLSFYSALETGAVYALDREIEKLSVLNDSQYKSDVNIVILGTIAGGTGSGSFLQMGMYMRKYFMDKNPNATVFIQGVFLLPDTITKTGSMVESEWDNVRFNAYAALKELNAVLSPSVLEKVNIELEYRPNIDSKITYENRPYDNILFFDYENSRNQHLNTLIQYKTLLAQTVYYAYISPISSDYQSRFVNQIREFILNNQESFYSASSVNKLVYPYQDIVKYLTLEWIIEEIDSEWLQFDKQYQDEITDYKIDLKKGVNRPKPNLDEIYIDNLDRMERGDPTSFYRTVFKQTRVYNEDTAEIEGRKDKKFISELEEHIHSALQADKELVKYKGRCEIQPMLLEEEDNAKGHIIELESALKKLENISDNVVHRHKNILLKDIMTHHCGRDKQESEHKHNINYWLIPANDTMHPVAVRYFLYRTKRSLSKKLAQLEVQITDSTNYVKNYYKKYDIPTDRDTENETYYESSIEVISMISGQSAIDKMKNFVTNNKSLQFKPFIGAFSEHYSTQVRHVNSLIELRLKYGVLENLLTYVSKMIDNWSDLFDMLSKNLMEDIEISRNKLLHKHEKGEKDIYIFQSPENKKLLWESIRGELLGEVENATLSSEIAKAQYELFCTQVSPEKNFDDDFSVKKLYRGLLENAYESALLLKQKKLLDNDIKEAISLEKRLVGGDDISLSEYIQKITNKNLPWMHTSADKLILTKFWGTSDSSFLDSAALGGNITVSKEFPKNEIVYLVMFHNLLITDFAKFAVRHTLTGSKIEGAYFQAYHKLMNNIANEPEKYVTPHIDKRWNSATYMPDLNTSVEEQSNQEITRAFVTGLIDGTLYKEDQDGVDYFYSKNGVKSEIIKAQGVALEATRWFSLYEELKNNPVIVGNIIRLNKITKDASLSTTPWLASKDAYVKLLKNPNTLKELVTMLTAESKDVETYDKVLDIIRLYGTIISDYIKEGYGDRKLNTAKKEIDKLKDALIKKLSKSIDGSALADIKDSLNR